MLNDWNSRGDKNKMIEEQAAFEWNGESQT